MMQFGTFSKIQFCALIKIFSGYGFIHCVAIEKICTSAVNSDVPPLSV